MVDYLRSCYRANVIFDPDRPDQLTEIVWFRCAPGAPALGVPTVFCSQNWDDGGAFVRVGEVRKTKTWVQPNTLKILPGAHPGRCGNSERWMEGGPASLAPPLDPATGLPACCATSDLVGARGNFRPGERYGIRLGQYLHGRGCGEAYGGDWRRILPRFASVAEVLSCSAADSAMRTFKPSEVYCPRVSVAISPLYKPAEAYPVPCMHASLFLRGKPGEVYDPPITAAVRVVVSGGEATEPAVSGGAIREVFPAEAVSVAVVVTTSSGVTVPWCGVPVNSTLTWTCTAVTGGTAPGDLVGKQATLNYNSSFGTWTGSVTCSIGTINLTIRTNSGTNKPHYDSTGAALNNVDSTGWTCGPPCNLSWTAIPQFWTAPPPGTLSFTVTG